MAKWKEIPVTSASEEWDSMVEAASIALSRLTTKGDKLADLVDSTPSPEAIVKAALERAEDFIPSGAECRTLREGMAGLAAQYEARAAIRSLASNPAEVAAIIKKAAGEDRG